LSAQKVADRKTFSFELFKTKTFIMC